MAVDVKFWASEQNRARLIFATPRNRKSPSVWGAGLWHTISTLLSRREYLVLSLRFGWLSRQPMALEDIAKLLPRVDRRGIGVTIEDVRRIETTALSKLRDPESMRKLRKHIRRPSTVYDSQGKVREIIPGPM
jgi:DNA-directed RNA polymerase sigma subunit (sigma70/sigma32)